MRVQFVEKGRAGAPGVRRGDPVRRGPPGRDEARRLLPLAGGRRRRVRHVPVAGLRRGRSASSSTTCAPRRAPPTSSGSRTGSWRSTGSPGPPDAGDGGRAPPRTAVSLTVAGACENPAWETACDVLILAQSLTGPAAPAAGRPPIAPPPTTTSASPSRPGWPATSTRPWRSTARRAAAIRGRPRSAPSMARLLREAGAAEEALAEAEEAVRLDPGRARPTRAGPAPATCRRETGDQAALAGRPRRTSRSLRLRPADGPPCHPGRPLRPAPAARRTRRGLAAVPRLDPGSFEAYMQLGAQYLAQGDADNAAAALQKAVELEPSSPAPTRPWPTSTRARSRTTRRS